MLLLKSNPSQWQAAAHWRIHEQGHGTNDMWCNGGNPKEVEILTDQEVIVEVEDQLSIVEVSRAIQGLFHWGGQAVTVSIVAIQDLITEIVKEWDVQREKQKGLEQEQWWLRENQQECQQQMI